MLEEYDGASITPSVEPNKVLVWIQIHKIPPLFRAEMILQQLATKVGEVIGVDMRVISTGNGDFHRARVNLLACTPLARVMTLSPEGSESMRLQVLYEKLPRFCAFCGLMGHTHLECGTGEFAPEELQYGGWMIADEETWHPGTPRVRGNSMPRGASAPTHGSSTDRGSRNGRDSRASVRGGTRPSMWKEKEKQGPTETGSRKCASEEANLHGVTEELTNTTSSPLKKGNAGRGDGRTGSNTQKQLQLGVVQDVPPPPPQYINPRERKCLKRDEARNSIKSPEKNKAVLGRDHRAQ
jgi:hypothetical protein